MSENAPVYSIAIPIDLVKDHRISASAKLMYGVIDSFQRKSGVCCASNDRLAEELGGCTARTASKCIGELKEQGYIEVEAGNARKITLKPYASDGQGGGRNLLPPEKKISTQVEENFQEGGRKFPPSNISSNRKEKDKKEKSGGKEGESLTDEQLHGIVVAQITQIAQADWSKNEKNEIYRLVMALYDPNRVVKKARPVRSELSVQGTFRKLTQGGSPNVMINMLTDAIIGGWQGVQVPRKDAIVPPAREERQYECM